MAKDKANGTLHESGKKVKHLKSHPTGVAKKTGHRVANHG
jgi:hypothetical protein